jgi:hypothetical protein
MAETPNPDVNAIAVEAIVTSIERRINSHRPGGYIGSRGMAREIYRGVNLALWSVMPCNITDAQLQFIDSITDQIMIEMKRPVCLDSFKKPALI